jgi:hypothetical protein
MKKFQVTKRGRGRRNDPKGHIGEGGGGLKSPKKYLLLFEWPILRS